MMIQGSDATFSHFVCVKMLTAKTTKFVRDIESLTRYGERAAYMRTNCLTRWMRHVEKSIWRCECDVGLEPGPKTTRMRH